ncbi:MAG: hypothetical protein DRJ10_16035, partial [Bacteroidetes bacterium]
ENNKTLTATNPQNLFFTWMPMNTGSPNSAFTTEYEFTLVEIWPDNRNPNDAINSMMPLYQTTTMNTAITYGPAEPQLIPGRKYVCRLRAYDTEGRDLFKNNGYSQILVFTFGQECLAPINISHSIEDSETAKANWQMLPGQTEYRLSYGEQNADGTWSNWYHNDGILPYSTIKELKPEHTYRYKLMAICGAIESEYSETKEFTTPKKKENEIECGKDVSVPDIDDSEPLQNLKIGDKINVGGFEATIIKTEGSGGTFTGKCVVHVTTFSFWVQSEFENISINQSMQVTAGEINAIKGELKLLNVDALLDSLGVGGGNEEVTNPEDSIFVFNPGDSIIVTLGGEDFIITGDTTIITAGGDTIITDLGLIPPIIIINGDTIIIDDNEMDLDSPEDGNVTEVVSDSTLYALNYVKFKEYENPTGINFGFDEYPPEIPQYLSEYKKEKVLDQEYIVPWQSAEANGKPVQVNMHIKTKVADSINTRLKVVMNNQPLNFTMSADNDTIRLLNLNGQGHKNKEQITAYYINDEEKEIPIGYLNLISYERQNFNLLIVPVDGEFSYTEFALKTYLNKVYAPAITSWEAQVADQLVVEYDETEENGLNTSRSFLSSFNKEMKSIIEAMKDRGDYSKENYYLFVMDKAENESLNGLMPFNSHFGFLFTGDKSTETKIFRTIAHELAHGAFKLKHNFDDKKTEKRSTQNLLDYTTTPETATVLRKFQWDEIISPRAIAFGWSEELYAEEETFYPDIISAIRQTNKKLGFEFASDYIVTIYPKWPTKATLKIPLGNSITNPEITSIDYTILKNNIKILSNEFNKEMVKNTKRVKFFFYECPESITTSIDKTKPAVTFELEEIQLNNFYEYIGISDIIEVKTLDISKTVDKKTLDDILTNRDHVNDRTNKAIYGNNVIKPAGNSGLVYYGKETTTPNIEGNSFIKRVKGLLWKELEKEGAATSINAYDGQHFTWGKGFAAGGQLENLIGNLLKNTKYKQIFQNMGIM